MLIGRAGRAFCQKAKRMSVAPSPTRMATTQAKVTFQSPDVDAFPTNTLNLQLNTFYSRVVIGYSLYRGVWTIPYGYKVQAF